MKTTGTEGRGYHHGDLRNALIQAGATLAERGGPQAVGVRAAAREVGVTPTAAYRHFDNAQALQGAVRECAFDTLAEGMRAELALVDASADTSEAALRRLDAIGRAYIRVALTEPGLFRTAFSAGSHSRIPTGTGSAESGRHVDTSFGMLAQCVDDLVTAGYLAPERRALAEFAAWSAVHGLARLILDGPLTDLTDEARDAVVRRTLEMVAKGIR